MMKNCSYETNYSLREVWLGPNIRLFQSTFLYNFMTRETIALTRIIVTKTSLQN